MILALEKDVELAPFTTYKIGGKADYFFTAKNKKDLIDVVSYAKDKKLPFFILGTGANILIGDKGFQGLVIHNKVSNFRFDVNFLIAESGAVVGDLIEASLQKSLSGLEHFIGIPSSVGGAIRQNLHFLSPDRKETLFIESIIENGLVLEGGDEKTVSREYFQFGYDDSILHHKDVIVLEMAFKLFPKDKRLIQEQIDANLKWRQKKQPQLSEFPSCGSVFKKIEGIGAGRLIEKAGLKGVKIGGAQVSEKHANYLVNLGNATAEDVRALIRFIQERVQKETGHLLEPEIGFIGEF